MPILRRMALMSVERAIRSTPSSVIAPAVGSSSRLQQRSSVLLPEPDGPMMKTSSCGATARSMPRSTSVRAEALAQPRTWRMGSARSFRRAGASGRPRISAHRSLWVRVARAPGRALNALRRVRRRIVARHVGHAVAREHGHRGGARRAASRRTTSRASSRSCRRASCTRSRSRSACATRRNPCASARAQTRPVECR